MSAFSVAPQNAPWEDPSFFEANLATGNQRDLLRALKDVTWCFHGNTRLDADDMIAILVSAASFCLKEQNLEILTRLTSKGNKVFQKKETSFLKTCVSKPEAAFNEGCPSLLPEAVNQLHALVAHPPILHKGLKLAFSLNDEVYKHNLYELADDNLVLVVEDYDPNKRQAKLGFAHGDEAYYKEYFASYPWIDADTIVACKPLSRMSRANLYKANATGTALKTAISRGMVSCALNVYMDYASKGLNGEQAFYKTMERLGLGRQQVKSIYKDYADDPWGAWSATICLATPPTSSSFDLAIYERAVMEAADIATKSRMFEQTVPIWNYWDYSVNQTQRSERIVITSHALFIRLRELGFNPDIAK